MDGRVRDAMPPLITENQVLCRHHGEGPGFALGRGDDSINILSFPELRESYCKTVGGLI